MLIRGINTNVEINHWVRMSDETPLLCKLRLAGYTTVILCSQSLAHAKVTGLLLIPKRPNCFVTATEIKMSF